jgi:hypothetical protein
MLGEGEIMGDIMMLGLFKVVEGGLLRHDDCWAGSTR